MGGGGRRQSGRRRRPTTIWKRGGAWTHRGDAPAVRVFFVLASTQPTRPPPSPTYHAQLLNGSTGVLPPEVAPLAGAFSDGCAPPLTTAYADAAAVAALAARWRYVGLK